MTLIGAILDKVRSKEAIAPKKYSSPPPELNEDVLEKRMKKKKRKPIDLYPHVQARVDSSPPHLQPRYMFRHIEDWTGRLSKIYAENMKLVMEIKRHHFMRGKVDCRWDHPLKPIIKYYKKRKDFCKRVQEDNKIIYERILSSSQPRIVTTKSLLTDWRTNRSQIIAMATLPFVLFPPESKEVVDAYFVAPPGVIRPRIQVSLRVEGFAALGCMTIELFTEVCPLACRLFTELMDGDGSGHGYVGTCFFRKVPNLYWTGGDVIYDNGFGCYAQVGRLAPIGAENYHFPHSMPGLLSMRMTPNDEMCGIFNITFKPLPQFDLKNVVFGRVIRPCSTYEVIRTFGSAFSTHPVVRIEATRRRENGLWIKGEPNEKLQMRRTLKAKSM